MARKVSNGSVAQRRSLPIWGLDPNYAATAQRHRDDSLIGQVVAANVVLVTLTAGCRRAWCPGSTPPKGEQRWQFVVLGLVIVLTFCVNIWMLQRRFGPLEHLIDRIERIDPAEPATFEIPGDPVEEIDRLAHSFQPPAPARGRGAQALGQARAPRAGGGAPPRGARPARRGQPGPHGDPAAARGAGARPPARASGGGGRAQAPRQPGDGRAAEPGAPAAPHRAGRPRPRPGHRGPAARLRRAHGRRGHAWTPAATPTRSTRRSRR